ncbi:MAG: hypothetical protein ACRC7O_10455 [Fimbriiglobus sp.]
MPITYPCPCGQNLEIDDEHAGQMVTCPICQLTSEAPGDDPVVVDEDPSKPREK